MPAPGAAQQEPYLPPHFTPAPIAVPFVVSRPSAVAALSWAILASTLHRIRRGECALLAVNLSLILYHAPDVALGAAQAVVSALAIVAMYAFNDLYDAPVDWNNPKKDRALIATWIDHRRSGVFLTFALKVATLILALATLGPKAAMAVAAVMVVNIVYSTFLKGVPVADVAAVWLWGALYACIVGASAWLACLVGLMTGICHLFQVLDDREPDAANGIQTTAVRSAALSRNVLVMLSLLLFLTLHGPLGLAGAVTALTPLAIFFAVDDAGMGWLLTKGYFGLMWLYLLGSAGAVR